MTEPEWLVMLDTLRDRMIKDSAAPSNDLIALGGQAVELLESLGRSHPLSPNMFHLLLQLKRSVDDFYNPAFTRGWTLQFALSDIQKLQSAFDPIESGSVQEIPPPSLVS